MTDILQMRWHTCI